MRTFADLKDEVLNAMRSGFVPEGNIDQALSEIENLMELRKQALDGKMVDDQPACEVLEKAYDHKSHLAYNGLFPILQEGYFSADDWRQMYLPYCH